MKTRLYLFLERILARFTDKIIVLSDQQFKELCYQYKIAPAEKFSIIPLGLDIDKFLNCDTKRGKLRKEFEIAEKVILVGIVGRLVPVKNHRMFLDAVAEVNKQKNRDIPKKFDTKFIIVGDGELRSELEAYAKKLGVEDHIIFAGWRKDLDTIYADLDIVVLTSLNEGTPLSFIEAMASRKPVIGIDTGGVSDLLDSNHNSNIIQGSEYRKRRPGTEDQRYEIYEGGILVGSGDVLGFAEAIRLLLVNNELREKMGEKGRKLVEEKHRKERLYKDIEGLYMEILGERLN